MYRKRREKGLRFGGPWIVAGVIRPHGNVPLAACLQALQYCSPIPLGHRDLCSLRPRIANETAGNDGADAAAVPFANNPAEPQINGTPIYSFLLLYIGC